MKRMIRLTALFLLILCLTGCEKGQEERSGYRIFYTNTEGTMLLSANYMLSGSTTLELIQDMWQRMKEISVTGEQCSLVVEGLEIEKLDLTDGQLTVTFNSEYLKMDNVQEILLRAGLVEGAAQFAEVKTVVFHIGEDVLRNHAGEPIGAMTRETFINNPVGINSYQYASLSLYFSNFMGNAVVKEIRNVHYSTNATLEKVVLEQILKGPMNKSLNPVLTENVKVLDAKVEEDTCIVNFNASFAEELRPNIQPEVIIYSIVNSLCDVLGVAKVQFQVEGSSDVTFAGALSLAGPFHRNSEVIEKAESMTGMESEIHEEELGQPSVGL